MNHEPKHWWMERPNAGKPDAGFVAFLFLAVVLGWPLIAIYTLSFVAYILHWIRIPNGMMLPIVAAGVFASWIWAKLIEGLGLMDKYHLDGRKWNWR